MPKPPSLDELMKSFERRIFEYVDQIFDHMKSSLDVHVQDVVTSFLQRSITNILNNIMKSSPERIFLYIIDVMFAPNLVLRQVVLILSLQLMMIGAVGFSKVATKLISSLTPKGRKMRKLRQMMENSRSYDAWLFAANELDVLYGYDKWRKEEYCPFFDYRNVSNRIRDTQEMMKRGDVFHLMFRLRGGLARDQYGIQHEGLFTRAFAGTKNLVEKYHNTMSAALNQICDTPFEQDNIPTDAKLAFFNETRHAFGRTALLLSGGAFMGYYHLGVCKALFQQNLLPRVISGASAGSLIAASVGTKTDEEFLAVLHSKERLLKNCYHFFRYSTHIKSETGRWMQYYTPQWLRPIVNPLLYIIFDKKFINLDTEYFKSVVMDLAGLWTFQEAFDRTGRIINITVAPLNDYDPPRLLNYLTAPHVCVWSAAAASCALPGIFDSFQLIVKEPNGNFSPESLWTRHSQKDQEFLKSHGYSDGSLENDLPMKQLSELFNVSHFIVSQVNPHSGLLSSLSLHTSIWTPPLYGAIVSYIKFLLAQFRDWIKNVSNLLVSRSLAPVWSTKRGITQLLTQDYEGRSEDITIFPWKGHLSVLQAFLSVFKNPTEQEFLDVILAAERQTWPLLSRIQANSQVELTLDSCVQRLRRRVSDENDAAANNVSNNEAKKSTLDRTPSFYTSRSIVNLSGLSVSDPLPNSIEPRHMPKPVDSLSYLNYDPLTFDVKGDDIPLADDSRYGRLTTKLSSPDGIIRRRKSNSKPLNLQNDENTDTLSAFSPLQQPLRRRNYSISSNDSTPGMYLNSSNDQLDELESESRDQMFNRESRIKKTTSMARFYYRENGNSTSDEALSKLK